MTIYELMIIAVAAGVFMIINIIMWSVISHNEKKAAEKEKKQPAVEAVPPADNIPAEKTAAEIQDTIHRERPADFIITEDIVFVHTDETL